jgi:AcrR family transcriptional regulator
MPKRSPPIAVVRRPRMDAQRNRERILEVARAAFKEHGAEATMDDIARRAAVGSGTLYRHFPTRDELIEAVYRSQVEKLTAAGQHYAGTLQPLEALRAWMLVFIDYVADKLLILPAMDTVPGGSRRMMEGTHGVIHSRFRELVESAIESGDLVASTDPDDIIRALIGVFHTTSLPGWDSSARRIVDILIEGARRKPNGS